MLYEFMIFSCTIKVILVLDWNMGWKVGLYGIGMAFSSGLLNESIIVYEIDACMFLTLYFR